jgi:hypothetical protein
MAGEGLCTLKQKILALHISSIGFLLNKNIHYYCLAEKCVEILNE